MLPVELEQVEREAIAGECSLVTVTDAADGDPLPWLQLDSKYKVGRFALPQIVLVSAIFSGRNYRSRAKRREYVTPTGGKPTLISRVARPDGDILIYQRAGKQLDQGAADVWQYLVAIALNEKASAGQVWVPFKHKRLLKDIGRKDPGVGDCRWLNKKILEISEAKYEMRLPDGTVLVFSLIGDIVLQAIEKQQPGTATTAVAVADITDNPRIAVVGLYLNTNILSVYATGWSYLSQSQRLALVKKPLAQYLHSYYSAHSAAHPRLVTTIRRESDNGAMQLQPFITLLTTALADLAAATGWSCRIEDDKVVINKHPAPVAAIAAPAPVVEPVAVPKQKTLAAISLDRHNYRLRAGANKMIKQLSAEQKAHFESVLDRAETDLGNEQDTGSYLELRYECALLVSGLPTVYPDKRVLALQAANELANPELLAA